MLAHNYRRLPLPSPRAFARRLGHSGVIAVCLLVTSLSIGTGGYHAFGRLSWVDSLHNAAMILTTMGPVDHLDTTPGKLFSTFYALFSGLMFITAFTVIATPIMHRMMHRFHLDEAARWEKESAASTDCPPPEGPVP